jgi:hypothetical protein
MRHGIGILRMFALNFPSYWQQAGKGKAILKSMNSGEALVYSLSQPSLGATVSCHRQFAIGPCGAGLRPAGSCQLCWHLEFLHFALNLPSLSKALSEALSIGSECLEL